MWKKILWPLLALFAQPFVVSAQPADSLATCFEERDLEIVNGSVRLPATLCLPRHAGGATVPAAVLIHGSGPNDRDETIGPNKPFAELAHRLAAAGVATLRYDKRTLVYRERMRELTPRLDYDSETVDDAVAALGLLRRQTGVDSLRCYVVGHSLGAMLAPRIAERAPQAPAGIVLWAPPARKMEVLLREQLQYVLSRQGGSAMQAEAVAQQMMATLPAEYLELDAAYQPVQTAARLTIPLLLLQGGHDYQVTGTDFHLWTAGLMFSRHARLCWLPTCDHLLRSLPEMAVPQDYAQPGQMSEEAFAHIRNFLKEER